VKIVIVGAGAMGCFFGANLARSGDGHRVTLLDKVPAVLAALSRRGVRLWEGDRAADVPVQVVGDPATAGPADLVLVMVKALHTDSAGASLAPLLGPTTRVLTLQNGLGAAQVLARHCDPRLLLVGVTAQGATQLGPGEIRHGGAGETLVGPYQRGGAAGAELVEAFGRAGLPTRSVDDPWPAVWRKLAVNCGINALAALTGLLNGRIPEIPEAAGVLTDAVAEVAAVARAAGIDLGDTAALAGTVLGIARATGGNRASMGQDVDQRRPTEIDFINGAVVREGDRLGVPAPVNRALTRLVKTLEAGFNEA